MLLADQIFSPLHDDLKEILAGVYALCQEIITAGDVLIPITELVLAKINPIKICSFCVLSTVKHCSL